MMIIQIIISYFIMGLLIWIGFPYTDRSSRRPKFWRFFFAWGPALLSHKIKIWIWKKDVLNETGGQNGK